MSKSRRVLSLVLCLLMLLSAVPLFPVESEAATTYLWPVVNGTAKTKYTVVGAVVGGKLYGAAYARNVDSVSVTSK